MAQDFSTSTFAAGLLDITEQVKPLHEWLDGQRAHFLSQGYTADEARAMAAAEFVLIFGSVINRTSSDGNRG